MTLGALTALSPFSIDMYLPAFPEIAQDLNTTVAKISLSLSSYFIGLASGQLFYGPLLDRFGRKKPLYAGLSIYILASLGCLVSHTTDTLIAFRFIQAIGGCAAGVTLKPVPILKNYVKILKVPSFYTYAFTSAIGFSGLFVYVAGSPILFIEVFKVSAQVYGWIFAFNAAGFVDFISAGLGCLKL